MSPKYEITPTNLVGLRILPTWFEGPVIDFKYKLRLGQTHYYYMAADDAFIINKNDLIYYRNSSNPCGNFMPVEVKENSIPQSVNLYPNPASISLTITSPNKIAQITITNLLGQTVYTQNYNTDQIQIDVSAFPAGMYFVKINGSEVRKFVKM